MFYDRGREENVELNDAECNQALKHMKIFASPNTRTLSLAVE